MVVASRAPVPIIRVPIRAFFAVQVRMDGHPVLGLKLINQRVSTRPVSLGVPPKRRERRREARIRRFLANRSSEFLEVHHGPRKVTSTLMHPCLSRIPHWPFSAT